MKFSTQARKTFLEYEVYYKQVNEKCYRILKILDEFDDFYCPRTGIDHIQIDTRFTYIYIRTRFIMMPNYLLDIDTDVDLYFQVCNAVNMKKIKLKRNY
jgi:hypothetical protein